MDASQVLQYLDDADDTADWNFSVDGSEDGEGHKTLVETDLLDPLDTAQAQDLPFGELLDTSSGNEGGENASCALESQTSCPRPTQPRLPHVVHYPLH